MFRKIMRISKRVCTEILNLGAKGKYKFILYLFARNRNNVISSNLHELAI